MKTFFPRFATSTSLIVGKWQTFVLAVFLVLAWVVAGFWVGFTDPVYQLWINTITTIITFLVVFLIQNSQNRDTAAIHLKLDELVRATAGARNEVAAAELLAEDKIKSLRADRTLKE